MYSLPIYSSGYAGASTMSLSESDFHIVICWKLNAWVNAWRSNWLRFQQRWWIGLHGWVKTRYDRIRLRLRWTLSDITACGSTSPMQHLQYPRDNLERVYKLGKCCRCRFHTVIIRLLVHNCQTHHFGFTILLISFTEVVGCMIPFQLDQFVMLHLLLLKPLHELLYWFGDCAHHSAGFVIFTQLGLVSLFTILIFPILPIVGTCKITQSVSNSNHHLL